MKPVIAIISETSQYGPHRYHRAADKYVQALVRCADITPVIIPSLETPVSYTDIAAFAHGILFTGGYSNIQRHHYGLAAAPAGELEDPIRDKNTLTLIPNVIDAGMPLLAICRGFQELNVALGGTLHPEIHAVAGRFDHREDTSQPVDIQYGPAHSVSLTPAGMLAALLGETSFTVNSVHGQGLDRLAPSLQIEAAAEDGTIEAVSSPTAPGFMLGTQWHPEWEAWHNPQSQVIFQSFATAAQAFKTKRLAPMV